MWALAYIGRPYVEGARGPDAFDCWGIVRWALAEHFGVALPDYVYSQSRVERDLVLSAAVDRHADGFVRVAAPQEGAVAIFHHGNRRPHVGLAVSAEQFLHAVPTVGACISRFDTDPWRNGLSGLYLPHRRPA